MAADQQNVTRLSALESTDGLNIENVAVVTLATASAVTYTGLQIISGLILRDTAGAARADLFPTAVEIFAALNHPTVGASFDIHIRNTSSAANTITMTTNTGLTLSGVMTIAQNNAKSFKVVVTSPTAVTIYSLGTVVF